VGDIRRLIIHHTGVSTDPNPDAIARYQVSQRGMPGIGYHFLIRFDGRVQQTQPLTVASAHTTRHNDDSVGIAFAGSFMQGIPTPAQITGGAHLCAFLLDQLGLPVSAITGRRDVESGTASPGTQWSSGLRWRDALLAGVTQRLEAAGVSATATRRAVAALGEEEAAERSPQEELAELQRLAERLQAEMAELANRLATLVEEKGTRQ
jgi:N-acetyl-anhydromuramyl-L-alanine amidase AmpD